MADQKWYDEGLRPRILINWDSFETWGISPSWKGPVTDAVINAYTRWMNVAGVDLRFQFWNYTTKTSADPGELLIKMNEKHFDSGRLASTFGGYNRLEIVIHRKRGSDLTIWNYVPYNAEAGEYDMQSVLMHEMGHCLGLDHEADAPTVMSGYSYFARFGPFKSDVADVRSLYTEFSENRLRQQRSSNGGGGWSLASNNITSHGSTGTRTNLSPGVVATPLSGFYVVGWSRLSTAPSWLRGDGNDFLLRHWLFYGGERSIYGPAYARDNDRTLLWAWVDDAGAIKIVRSRNQGYQWHFVSVPANAITYGTPGLCWTSVNGQSTWILVWSQYDRSDRDTTGHVRASLSTNNGSSWSAPVVLNDFYKTLSGVSVAADAAGHVVVAFSWAPNSTSGMNYIRSFNCEMSGGELRQLSINYGADKTRIQPALAFDAGTGRFVMAWRGQDFATTLNTASKPPTGSGWTGHVYLRGVRSHVAPALAYSPEYAELAMWYAFEGA